jgi:multiple sugar transport system ATP-binding protein
MELRLSAHGLLPGDAVTVGIRPEHLRVGEPADAQARGRIELVEQLGESHLLYVRTAEQLMAVRAPGDARRQAGEDVGLTWPIELCHVFDRTGRALGRGDAR